MNTIVMPRYSGKTASVICRALTLGSPIAVIRETTKQRILETAATLGVDPPEIILIEKEKIPVATPTVAFIDYDL